ITNLYNGVPNVSNVSISIQKLGPNVVLSWPQGTLLEATNVTGPWTTNPATSPYTNAPTSARKFYRVQLQSLCFRTHVGLRLWDIQNLRARRTYWLFFLTRPQ